MSDIQIDSDNATPPPTPPPEEAGFGAKVIGKTTLAMGPASYRHLTWAAIVSILSAMVFAAVITLQFLEQKDMKAEPSVWHPVVAE